MAWSPAASPIRACPSVNRTSSPMMLMSARRATANPAPTATPLIAEMIALSHARMLLTSSRASLMTDGNFGKVTEGLTIQFHIATG